jgi:tetratricopeptide (TPR) repeat protein
MTRKQHAQEPDNHEPHLHIKSEELDEVMNLAVHLQAAKDRAKGGFVADDTVDEIAKQTGISKEMLAQAQAGVVAQHQHRRLKRIGGGLVVGLLLLFPLSLAWQKLFPFDPIKAAVHSEGLRKQALAARLEKDYPTAIDLASEAVSAYPGYLLALNELGLSYEGNKDYVSAQKTYRQSIKLGATQRDACFAYFNLAHLLDTGPQKEEAVGLYQQAVACRPDFAPAFNYLGQLYERLGKYDLAMNAYASTVKADQTYHMANKLPASYLARLHRGETMMTQAAQLFAAKKVPDALSLAHTAVNAYPGNSVLLRDVGVDNDGDAKDVVAESSRLEAEAQEAYNHKHYDQAIQLADEAVQVNPDNFEAMNLWGLSYHDQGPIHFKEAETSAAFRCATAIRISIWH